MKRFTIRVMITFLIAFCLLSISQLRGQANKPLIPFFTGFYKSEADPFGFKNLPITVEITLKKFGDTTITAYFIEKQELTLNQLANIFILIGNGTDQDPPWSEVSTDSPSSVCYKATVHTPDGDVVISGESPVGSVFQANAALHASEASNTFAINHIPWVGENIGPYLDTTIVGNLDLVVRNRKNGGEQIDYIPMGGIFGFGEAPSAVNQEPTSYFLDKGFSDFPITFGRNSDLNEVENFHTYCFLQNENLFNGAGFKFIDSPGEPITHTTAAVYAENIFEPFGVGLIANGLSRGSYNQGQTGALGICNNLTGNGAGLWGYIGVEPASGNANYALLGSTNGFPNTFAAYLQGNVLYTGTLIGPSDIALKTEVRSASHGLSTIMSLRPTTYQYRSDAPYSLPGGVHHGFIAQEMEAVMPELVSEIPLIANGGSVPQDIGDISTFKGINYMELIPVLTRAIQELNMKVEAQAKEIEQLQKEIKACSKPK